VITGLAHSGVCVPDCEAAVAFYRDVLGMRVLSPPYVMAGDAIRDDMGQLVSDPTMKAAIVGFDDDGDRVLEVIEYLGVAGGDQRNAAANRTWPSTHQNLRVPATSQPDSAATLSAPKKSFKFLHVTHCMCPQCSCKIQIIINYIYAIA